MSRRAHPKAMVKRAHTLRTAGLGYGRIARMLVREFAMHVGESTVRDWVTYYTRGPA